MSNKNDIDKSLGEDRAIPRRDFIQGALVGAATALTGPMLQAYAADAAAATLHAAAPEPAPGAPPRR